MHVVYASNDNYVPFLGISILSLLINNRNLTELNLVILSDEISIENRKLLNDIAEEYERNIKFIDIDNLEQWIPFEFDTFGFHPIVLSRLFLGKLLEEDVNRVLYLDCDTVVEGSIEELQYIDMEKEYVAMVPELYMPMHKKELVGISSKESYYNAGVILFNLDLIRRDKMQDKFLEYYCEKKGRLLYNDQDIINHCCNGKIKQLNHRYNLSPNLKYFPRYFIKRLQPAYYSQDTEKYKYILKNPVVIHFMGDERPWIRGNFNAYRKYFMKYKEKSPWKDMVMIKGKEWYMMCYHILNLITFICPWFRIGFSNLIGINKYAWFGKE